MNIRTYFWLILTLCFVQSIHATVLQISRQAAVSDYLYNFARTIEWQNESAMKEFTILVVGQDESILREIRMMATSKKVRNKPIRVLSSPTLDRFENVQMVFLLKGKEENILKIVDRIQGENILLVSDNYLDNRFIMINLYNGKDGALHFEMNKDNILNQHLRILPDMILLGGAEVDVASAVTNKEIQESKDSFLEQAQKVQDQQKILNSQSLRLKQIEEELKIQKQKIENQQSILKIQTRNLEAQSMELAVGNEKLRKEKSDIVDQKSEIASQSNILRSQSQVINRQHNLVIFLAIIIFFVFVLIFTIYDDSRNKRKLNKELERKVQERTNDLNELNQRLKEQLAEREQTEKKLRITEERYRYLFEHNPAPMFIYEREELRILAVNDAFLSYYGFTADEVVYMVMTELYLEEEKAAVAKIAKNIKGYKHVGEWHHIRKDRSIISVIAVSHDLVYMGKQSQVVVVTDISERKMAEDKINELNQTLEERVAERTAQLVSINKDLESFSYSISHDLRAPLRAIFGFSQILANRHRDSLNEEGKQYMNYIVEASIRMELLINDLLDYSRLGRKSLNIRMVPLGKIIGEVSTYFKEKLNEIGAEFIIDQVFPVVLGDESLFRQILTNLIENAIIYRRPHVPLILRIHCEKVENGYQLRVSDNGIGIPKEYSEKIFNIFQRLHTEDEFPGTGIGLATVQKAVSMLNGTIWVESIVGEGSTFIINLPEFLKQNHNGNTSSDTIGG